jgi:hypothetical protein
MSITKLGLSSHATMSSRGGRKCAVRVHRGVRLNNRGRRNVLEFLVKFKLVSKKYVDNRRNVLQRLILAVGLVQTSLLFSARAMR